MSEANEASVRRAVDAFNDPSGRELYLDLYAPDVVLHGYPPSVEGREGACRFYSELWAAFPDARLSLDEMIASDDRLAARYTLTGIQAQDVGGAPLSNRATRIQGITWLRFRDGQAVEVWQSHPGHAYATFCARGRRAHPAFRKRRCRGVTVGREASGALSRGAGRCERDLSGARNHPHVRSRVHGRHVPPSTPVRDLSLADSHDAEDAPAVAGAALDLLLTEAGLGTGHASCRAVRFSGS